MTSVKFTISLPADLAALAQAQENTSAFIADALRLRVRVDRTAAALAKAGVPVVPVAEFVRLDAALRETARRRRRA